MSDTYAVLAALYSWNT